MAQSPAPAQPQNQSKPRLGEMLIRDGLITNDQLTRALEEQRSYGGRLGRHLVDLGFLSDSALLDALSRQLRIPRIDLEAPGTIAPDASRYARADLAEQWGFCPIMYDAKRSVLVVAVSDPDPQLLVNMEGFLAMRVEPRIASADVIDRVARRLFHGDGTPVQRMAGLQIARGEAKNAVGLNEGLGLSAPMAAVPQPAVAPPPAVNPYDAQLAHQVALQQQLQQQMQQQMQMQQMQLQAQQVAAQQAAAQQAAAQQAAAQQAAAQQAAVQQAAAQQVAAQQAALQGLQNGLAASPLAYANGFASPGAGYPAYPQPGKPPALVNGALPMMPVAPLRPAPSPPVPAGANPGGSAAIDELREQVARLEKTLSAQARALRSLVEVLVDKGLLSKVEMARKQQNNK